jgi:uncharacterized protein
MIVYSSNKAQFLEDVFSNNIDGIILEKFKYRMGKSVSSSEVNSWKNSLTYMYKILNDEEIPEDSGVAIEYNVPQTSKRIEGSCDYYRTKAMDGSKIYQQGWHC